MVSLCGRGFDSRQLHQNKMFSRILRGDVLFFAMKYGGSKLYSIKFIMMGIEVKSRMISNRSRIRTVVHGVSCNRR